MPNYTAHPAFGLYPGQVVKPFDAESPANGQASQAYALPYFVTDVGVDIYFASAPSAVQVDIEIAEEDVEARYRQAQSSTVVTGEHIDLTNLSTGFIRVKKVSQAGGGAITVVFRPKARSK